MLRCPTGNKYRQVSSLFKAPLNSMPKLPNNNLPRLLNKREYLAELTERISKLSKGDRATVMTMGFDVTQPEVATLVRTLSAAAEHGADIVLSVDAYSFLVKDYERPDWIARQRPATTTRQEFAQRWAALQSLGLSGGHYVITNQVQSYAIPAIGRSHIKFAVINDDVWVGGCNLNDMALIDLMAAWHDKPLADWLAAFPGRADAAGSVRATQQLQDGAVPTTWDAELLVDAGVRGQSRIMEQALRLIDEAEEYIFMTCQYFPSGITIRKLAAAARRGVQIELIYNNPAVRKWPNNWSHQILTAGERLIRPSVLFAHELPPKHPYIHAKLLVTEKAAMLGSHNYVEAGVLFGTAEVALLSQDSTFATKAKAALYAQIMSAL